MKSRPGFDFARYLNIRSAYGASFSPTGERLAFLTDITGVPQVWAIDRTGGWPDQLTFFAERVTFVSFSPREEHLVFGMDSGGNERQQLFLLSADGQTITPLTDAPEAIHQFGGWSYDGRRIAFSATRRHPAHFDVYLHELDTGESHLVWETEGYNYPQGFSPDDNLLLIGRANSNLDNDLYLLDLTSGQVGHLTPHQGDVRYHSARWSPDSAGFYLSSDLSRDFMNLACFDLSQRELRFLEERDWDVEEVEVSKDGRWLAYLTNVDGYSELSVRRLPGLERVELPALPAGWLTMMDFSRDGRYLALTLTGPEHNPDVWQVDLELATVHQITRSSRAGIPQTAFATPELVHYPSFDGLHIPAFFYRPPDMPADTRLPVIVHVHGGPEAQAQATFNNVIQYFINCGYAVFAPNVRGSTGYGKAYTHLDDVEKRMDSVADLKYGVEWLRASGQADPDRIAVYGGSYGGFMVLAGMTTYPDLWAAGVDIVGIANFITFLENTGAYRRHLRIAEYGDPVKDREFLERISPINHAHEIRSPLIVIHGANDPRVPVGEAEQIVAALSERHVPVEYLRFEDEGHGIVKLPNRIKAYTAIAKFLGKYVGQDAILSYPAKT
ncbi:MAG: peptidase S9 [Chloroflexi bacterium RBG_16_57_9]|nr:MAG: peptidase S9 [Chloroflexi bacterium RBG_16_57_9]